MWQILSAAAGGLALTLIVGIAVGVFLLTLVYLASAVVVLERFAGTSERLGLALLVGAGLAAPTAWLLLDAETLGAGALPSQAVLPSTSKPASAIIR